jgi:uncharacterized protein
MKLTNPEKLILVMLAELHEKVGVKDGTDTKLLTSAIYSDNTWALDWEMPGIVGDCSEPTPVQVTEVTNILDMWSFIEEAYEKFDAAAKAKIKLEAAPFEEHVRFTGFDGNNETKYVSVARFLVEDMNRFSRFKNRDLNSHRLSIESLLRMFSLFETIRPNLADRGLSADEVIQVLNARKHPTGA